MFFFIHKFSIVTLPTVIGVIQTEPEQAWRRGSAPSQHSQLLD